MMTKEIVVNNFKVILINKPNYTPGSENNIRYYENQLDNNVQYQPSSVHGLIVGNIESPFSSVVLLGDGGTTCIHENSMASNKDICFVAVSDSVFALKIPTLELIWAQRVDQTTCFAVFWLECESYLIIWGS